MSVGGKVSGWATIVCVLAELVSGGPVSAQGPVPEPGTSFRECRDCPEMKVVPRGRFTMGSPASEAGRFANEGPQHTVTIARPFAIGVYDVTVGDYSAFVRATGRPTTDECRIYDPTFVDPQLVRVRGKSWRNPNFAQTNRDPVVCVTFDDAQAYVAWLNGKVAGSASGMREAAPYRLPTEAEWEYAARAGTQTPYPWGTAITRGAANYGPDELRFAPVAIGADRWMYTSPVGSFPANGFGLFDMVGNAWNFTQDCWRDDYNGGPTDGAAYRAAQCNERVVRGGSWFKPPAGERSAKRGEGKPVDLKGNAEIGFRVVRDLDIPVNGG